MRSIRNRDYTNAVLRAKATAAFPGHTHAKSLQTGIDRFAKWRWKTLAKVCAGLEKLSLGIQGFAQVQPSAEDMCARDQESARAFLRVAGDPEFWGRADALRAFLVPATGFSGWVGGCSCHEAELLARKNVNCPWKGCRAVDLSQRVKQLLSELSKLREMATEGCHRGVAANDYRDALSRMMSSLALKLAWVDDPPFLVWQARALAIGPHGVSLPTHT